MKPKTQPHQKKIAQLLARHLRLGEKGRDLFDRSSQALDEALALAVPVGQPIPLRDGRTVVVADQFATQNHAFAAKLFNRFRVTEYREPRPPKATRPEAPAPAPQSSRECEPASGKEANRPAGSGARAVEWAPGRSA